MTETALRQIRKLLDDYGLRVAAINFPTRRGYDVAEDLEARIAGTKEAIKLAYQLRAPAVVIQAGRVPAESSGPQWNQLVEVLSDLGRFSHRAGSMLAAQTGAESGADLARLIGALPGGSLGVDLDPANLIVNGFSPAEAVDALGADIIHVHATDAVRDLARGRGSEVALGAEWPISRICSGNWRNATIGGILQFSAPRPRIRWSRSARPWSIYAACNVAWASAHARSSIAELKRHHVPAWAEAHATSVEQNRRYL